MTLMTKHPHDGSEFDFDALPDTSRANIVATGLNHHYGNQVASQVVAYIRSVIAGENGKASEVSTDAVKSYRKSNPDEIAVKTAEFQATKKTAIMDGTLGVRVAGAGGSSVDPLRRETLRLGKPEIAGVFAANKWNGGKLPTGDKTFSIESPDGTITLDGAGWIARWVDVSTDGLIGGKGEPNGPRLERLAKRNLEAAAAKARAAANVAAQGSAPSGL